MLLHGETIWLTQRQMADLFDTTADNISLHLRNIYTEGELDGAATTEDFSVVQNEGAGRRAKLRDATRESIARNASALDRGRIMGVTNDRGMRPMREETIASSIERYKIVRPSAFAYNPMRLNVGSIAMSPFDRDVLVSPDYVVFECDESKLLPSYEPPRIVVRDMRSRWGSLSPAGQMTLNSRLAQAPRRCIEYVIVHELCHLMHRNHGPAFVSLLGRVMPDWQARKERLESMSP